MLDAPDDAVLLRGVLEVVCGLQACWGPSVPPPKMSAFVAAGLGAAASLLDVRAMAAQLALADAAAGLWDDDAMSGDGGRRVLGSVVDRVDAALVRAGAGMFDSSFSEKKRQGLIELMAGHGDGSFRRYLQAMMHMTPRDDRIAIFAAHIRVLTRLGAYMTVMYKHRACRAAGREDLAQAVVDAVTAVDVDGTARVSGIVDGDDNMTLQEAVGMDVRQQSLCQPGEGVLLAQALAG